MIQSTLRLYTDCARDTAEGVARSAWGLAALVVVSGGLYAAQKLLAPAGMAGGFLLGLIEAFGIGWYLALVEITIAGRRSVRPSDLKDNLGQYVWDVISVLFVFFVAQLLLTPFVPAAVMLGAVLVATLAFNPAPEMIYQERSNGTELLADAARFMQANWPEWVGPHVAAAIVLSLWAMLVTGGGFSIATGLGLAEMFGPFFGFAGAQTFAIASMRGGPVGLALGAALLVFVHAFMLFRGHLYRRLRGSTRRGRAWSTRTR